jgi:hypothetical protein
MFKKIKLWFVRFYSGLLPKKVEVTPPKKRKRRKEAPENWVYGDYAKAQNLLDDLEHRHDWLRGFRPEMSESGLRAIKKFGVYVCPREMLGKHDISNNSRLGGGNDRPMPTFMAVAYGGSKTAPSTGDYISGCDHLCYAEKHKWKVNSFNVEKPSGDYFYIFGIIVRTSEKQYHSFNTPLEILKDGSISILRMRKDCMVSIPHKKCNGDKRKQTRYKRKLWGSQGLPPSFEMENKGDTGLESRLENTRREFIMVYNDHLRRDASTSIHATKGNTRMIFTVPIHAWKDFFSDRITATAADGKKKRIFHHVAAHKRKNGQSVPMHTRGVTRFKWGGFNIKICEWKPGRHSFLDFGLTGEVFSKDEEAAMRIKGEITMGEEEMATKLLPWFTRDLHKPTNKAA